MIEVTNMEQFISQNALVLIPALYIVGSILKGTEYIKNKYIPLILLPLGIVGGVLITEQYNIQGVVQGILATGCSVYANQIKKQIKKGKEVIEYE